MFRDKHFSKDRFETSNVKRLPNLSLYLQGVKLYQV